MRTYFKLFMLVLCAVMWAQSLCAQQTTTDDKCTLKIGRVRTSKKCDTVYAEFKVVKSGKRIFSQKLLSSPGKTIKVSEKGYPEAMWPTIDTIIDIRQKDKRTLSDNMSILLLIDRSGTISDDLLTKQFRVVESFVKGLPDNPIYVSFMDGGRVTQSIRVDSATFANTMMTEFYTGDNREHRGEKHLYRAILSKLQELSGEEQSVLTYPEVGSNPVFKSGEEQDRMLFVFTDGKVINPKTGTRYGGDANYYACFDEFDKWEDDISAGGRRNIPIHCVFVGDEDPDETLLIALKALCTTGGDNEVKGRFYQNITPDSVQTLMMGTIDSLASAASDYRLVLLNPDGKKYDGSEILLRLELSGMENVEDLVGERGYAAGSKDVVVIVNHSHNGGHGGKLASRILNGLLYGMLFLAIVYVVFQFLVPMLRYKMFMRKYVKPFSTAGTDVVDQQCYICKDLIRDGDLVVQKCEHTMHKECWEQTHRCPQCSKGSHYYNKEKLTDPKNASHYLKWMMYGLSAGLVAWICFILLQSTGLFSGLSGGLAQVLYPFGSEKDNAEVVSDIVETMANKTRGLLIGGSILGFFIVFAFSWVLEFRKKDRKVVSAILIRSAVGAFGGFVAFLLGVVVITLCGKQYSCWWIDWIPWLFFALVIALVLWYKTEIKLKSALIGGAASVLFSFIILYLLTGPITSMFSYMLYSAGFGMSIAVVHFTSEKYFLRVSGPFKEREIAIYKWMSATGGFNKVSIGKSIDSTIQMNWDDSDNIADREVEVFRQNDRPFLKVIGDGVTQQGRTIPQNHTIALVNGTEFTIGKTTFTYVEKDR